MIVYDGCRIAFGSFSVFFTSVCLLITARVLVGAANFLYRTQACVAVAHTRTLKTVMLVVVVPRHRYPGLHRVPLDRPADRPLLWS